MIEKTVYCPFNPQHVMLESSLQRHVIKCMLKYPHWLVCPYNALHRSKNEDDLKEHVKTCQSKIQMESLMNEMNQEKLYQNSSVPVEADNSRKFNLAYEDWDVEIATFTYNQA